MKRMVLWMMMATNTAWAATTPAPDASSTHPALEDLASSSRAVVRGHVVHAELDGDGPRARGHYVVAVDATLMGKPVAEVSFSIPRSSMSATGGDAWTAGQDVVVFVPFEGAVRSWGALSVDAEGLHGEVLDHAEPMAVDGLVDQLHAMRVNRSRG